MGYGSTDYRGCGNINESGKLLVHIVTLNCFFSLILYSDWP